MQRIKVCLSRDLSFEPGYESSQFLLFLLYLIQLFTRIESASNSCKVIVRISCEGRIKLWEYLQAFGRLVYNM